MSNLSAADKSNLRIRAIIRIGSGTSLVSTQYLLLTVRKICKAYLSNAQQPIRSMQSDTKSPPGRIRTDGLPFRRGMLYPTELRRVVYLEMFSLPFHQAHEGSVNLYRHICNYGICRSGSNEVASPGLVRPINFSINMATIHITRNVSSNHWIIVSVEAKETLASVTLCKAFSRATEAQISRPAYKTAAITAPHFASTERNVHRPTVSTLSPIITGKIRPAVICTQLY